jgi:hypothetical protein
MKKITRRKMRALLILITMMTVEGPETAAEAAMAKE